MKRTLIFAGVLSLLALTMPPTAAIDQPACTPKMVLCKDGSPSLRRAPELQPPENPRPVRKPKAPGGTIICNYSEASYADAGGSGNTDFAYANWGVDDELGAHTFAEVSGPPVDAEYKASAWAHVGTKVKISNRWPDNVGVTVFFPWHWRGYQRVSVDGEHPTVTSTSTLRLAVWNLQTQQKDVHIVTEAVLTKTHPGSAEKTRIRDWNGTGDHANTIEIDALQQGATYAAYLNQWAQANVQSWWTAVGNAVTNWFTPKGKAWLDYVQWAFHMPRGWTVEC